MSRRFIKLLTIALVLTATTALAVEDHTEHITGPFESGPAVTKACLECHEDAATDVMKTSHWSWTALQDIPGKGEVDRGKKNTINNFCISVNANWPRCTSCHIGYGYKDASFDFADATKIDCLVCHDTTGTYKKNPKGAGMPNDDVDLLFVAQNVGEPTRETCGSCHFFGGGGDAVKHGDLDSSQANPTRENDVHLTKMSCQECHVTKNHQIEGAAMVVTPSDGKHIGCEGCHEAKPHNAERINDHMAKIACQTCHIPDFARVKPTKTSWDWSKAGEDRKVIEKDEYGKPTFNKKKGEFTWGKNIVPTYRWYDGTASAYLLGDKIDPTAVTELTAPNGSKDDPKSKIYPFKTHTGRQPYDVKNNYFVTPHLFGKDGYWKHYDWAKAAEVGMKSSGLDFSGEIGFADSTMYWRINHMVVPKDKALDCLDCHGATNRMDWTALGYDKDPMDK